MRVEHNVVLLLALTVATVTLAQQLPIPSRYDGHSIGMCPTNIFTSMQN